MRYSGNIFRPPSEAASLLVQVTIGCSHNKCTFCTMYRDKQFRVRDIKEVEEDLRNYPNKESVKKIFLMDGDALVLSFEKLVYILDLIKEVFPNVKQVSSYATFNDVNNKTVEELKVLYDKGLTLLYLGLESGSDKVLTNIKKNLDSKTVIEASNKLRKTNFKTSVMILAGLGGQELFNEHIIETAKVVNIIDPTYLGLLKLNVFEGTELYDSITNGEFTLLEPKQIVEEMKILVENLSLTNCMFSSAHASNHVNVKGILPFDKQRILKELDYYLNNTGEYNYYRGL